MRVQLHGTLTDGSEIHPIVTVGQVNNPDVAQDFIKLVLYTAPNRTGLGTLQTAQG